MLTTHTQPPPLFACSSQHLHLHLYVHPSIQGPDPTGTICWWTYNPADGWCYNPTSSWVYNPTTAVYYDAAAARYCQYDGATGTLIDGECVADGSGGITFVPAKTPAAPAP